jgi:phosphoglycerate kinase
MSHFGRPKGKYVPSLSLAPLVDTLSEALGGAEVHFSPDCIGPDTRDAVDALQQGEFLLLENLRFHPEEESGDADFAKALASLGDLYINDAFSCSHRAHASITGIARILPFSAGRLLQQEVETLTRLFAGSGRPLAAIIGGAKISTKLALLENLIQKVDKLIIGGAMANTFLATQGCDVGCSVQETELHETARTILAKAEAAKCEIILPVDVVAASCLEPQASSIIVGSNGVPEDRMIVDVGPESVMLYAKHLQECNTAVWNGPLGAFEVSPFDCSTVGIARLLAKYTRAGKLQTVAGGGDTVSAVSHAGLAEEFTYLSTAGGAFLEWLEGKTLPGVAALLNTPAKTAKAG